MLTAAERRRVIREMKADPPVSWPSEDELARDFVWVARQVLGVEVDEAEARAAVAGRFRSE